MAALRVLLLLLVIFQTDAALSRDDPKVDSEYNFMFTRL